MEESVNFKYVGGEKAHPSHNLKPLGPLRARKKELLFNQGTI